MKTKEEIFLFIAKNLEGIGQPKGDSAGSTIFGITKKYHPKDYNTLKTLIDNSSEKELIDDAIINAYTKVWEKSYANKVEGNLGYFYFDFYFNSPKAAVMAIQRLLREMYGNGDIVVDGILGKQTKGMIEKYLFDIDIEDIFWFNFYRRQHYSTVYKRWRCGLMNRVWKLESYIYGGK